jgi:hypothetical protein
MSVFTTKSQHFGLLYIDKIILNTKIQVASVTSEPQQEQLASNLVEQLKVRMITTRSRFFASGGQTVNYLEMSQSPDFTAIQELTSQLSSVSLQKFFAEFSVWSQLAFFVNLYNLLIIHSICSLHANSSKSYIRSLDTSLWERWKFYAQYSYVIDGAAYCLNDIENGILRGNSPSPLPFSYPPFQNDQNDPRISFVISYRDPRIHFALNCGAMSCPPILVYNMVDADVFQSQLHMATASYLENHVHLTTKVKSTFNFMQLQTITQEVVVVRISPFFKWFRDDFLYDVIQSNYGTEEKKIIAKLTFLKSQPITVTDRLIVEWIESAIEPNWGELMNPLKLKLQEFLRNRQTVFELEYEEYDWKLNTL